MTPTSRTHQIVRAVADGTGLTEEEVWLKAGSMVLVAVVLGVLRTVELVMDLSADLARLAHDLRIIPFTELPEPHEDGAAFPRSGYMRGAGWVAEIAAGRVVAMLILEDTVQYEDLLAAMMRVTRESAASRVAYNRRRTGDLAAGEPDQTLAG